MGQAVNIFMLPTALREFSSKPWMRDVAIVLALLCHGCGAHPNSHQQDLIAEVERQVHLPNGAGDLRCYRRYYSVMDEKELQALLGDRAVHEMIIGIYRKPSAIEKPGIVWMANPKDMPHVDDGGCDILRVAYPMPWPENEIKARCSPDISGDIPEKMTGRPPAC